MTLALFRYSGNKGRMVKHLPKVPARTMVIYEPFLGSGAYSLNQDSFGASVVGTEVNTDVVSIWQFLQTTSIQRLVELEELVEEHKWDKTDIRTLDLPHGEQSYLKVNCCSVMVGQLSSWKLSPKHKLPVKRTIQALDRAQHVTVVEGSCFDASIELTPTSFVFVDPPYLGTRGNYKSGAVDHTVLNKDSLVEWLVKLPCPALFTYGSDAVTEFPMFDWQVDCIRKVPNLRKGGTTERVEMFTMIDSPCET